jgi:hypothetical protein
MNCPVLILLELPKEARMPSEQCVKHRTTLFQQSVARISRPLLPPSY